MVSNMDIRIAVTQFLQMFGTMNFPNLNAVQQLPRAIMRACAAYVKFVQELTACCLFVIGPFILLVVPITMGAIVSFFRKTARRLQRDEEVAAEHGLDLAAYFTKNVYRLWHGQEFIGMENIPRSGGALIVYYHGSLPTDYIGLVAEIRYQYGRHMRSVVDRLVDFFPMRDMVNKNLGLIHSGQVEAIDVLKDGHLLGVAPGGVREAIFSEDYKVIWGERMGFARIAFDANVPIIPVFTENIQETYRTMSSFRFFWRFIYETIKFPIVPMWGGFPVKLITHIGTPIYPSKAETVKDLRDRTKVALEDLIQKYQSKKPSVTRAILQRLKENPNQSTVIHVV